MLTFSLGGLFGLFRSAEQPSVSRPTTSIETDVSRLFGSFCFCVLSRGKVGTFRDSDDTSGLSKRDEAVPFESAQEPHVFGCWLVMTTPFGLARCFGGSFGRFRIAVLEPVRIGLGAFVLVPVLVPFRIGPMGGTSGDRLSLDGRCRGKGVVKVSVAVASWRQDDL